MTVADLVILESILDYQKDDDIFTALHFSSTGCQSSEWHIYNGEDGLYSHMERFPENHYEKLYSKLNKLMCEIFNIQD